MNGIQNQISDQTNQAIMLLWGATAQSYSVINLNAMPAVLDLNEAGDSLPASDLTKKFHRSEGEPTLQSMENGVVETTVSLVSVQPAPLNLSGELSEPPTRFVELELQNPELMSRFNNASFDDSGSLGFAQARFTNVALNAEESLETSSTGESGFSLLDFIKQAIAQAEVSKKEFEETFDGSRQGEFRELLIDAGRELGSVVREFLQDNVAGAGRDLLASTLDTTGVQLLDPVADPLLNIDYYAKSAEVLNGLLDAVAQPISTFSLPQLGPLLADPREELFAYLG